MIENGMMEMENGFLCTKISTMIFNPIHSAFLFILKSRLIFLQPNLKDIFFSH